MEQYFIPKKLDWINLRKALNEYEAEKLFIRDCGGIREDGRYSAQGREKVNEALKGKNLDFRKDKTGLYMLIDNREVFHFPLDDYDKGFTIGYERIQPTEDGVERLVMLSHGINPDDSSLPEPRTSMFRTVLDKHLMEITFKGKIKLKFHSWWIKPDWKYWTLA
jgi:hypothetical protein